MEIPLVLNGLGGRVRVDYRRNSDPTAVGCPPETVGYPICTATVERPLRGYDSIMGWVQLVRSDDNDSSGERFEMDPLAFLGDLPHPYCWLGLNPTLFDAPSRSPRVDMDWMAHSFLCVPDDVGNGLEARPMLGFSWGFIARDGEITLVPPQVLDGAAWDGHLDTLRARHPRLALHTRPRRPGVSPTKALGLGWLGAPTRPARHVSSAPGGSPVGPSRRTWSLLPDTRWHGRAPALPLGVAGDAVRLGNPRHPTRARPRGRDLAAARSVAPSRSTRTGLSCAVPPG